MLSSEENKRVLRRLKIIEGQVRGLQRMVEENKYCVDIINQTSAVKKALSSVEDLLLENHLSTCVVEKIKNDKNRKKVIKEIIEIYKIGKNKT